MLDEKRRRRGLLLKDIERQRNQLIAVAFGEIRHRSDQPRTRPAQLCARFAQGVLAHYRALLRRTGFFKGAQRSQCADVVYGAYQRAARSAAAQIFAQHVQHLFKVSAAVETNQRRFDNFRQLSAQPVDQAGEA